MTKYLFMADTDSESPAESLAVQAYAGYVETSFDALVAKFGKTHHIFSIAMSASRDAECLDIENGDATAADARAWYLRMRALGKYRPCLYTFEANMDAVKEAMAGIPRSDYRLWIAAWSPEHPEALLDEYDAHQYYGTSTGPYDYSILREDFFPTPSIAPKPAHNAPKPVKAPKRKLTDIHPKVAAAGIVGAITTAVFAVLKSHGVHVVSDEAGAITTLATAVAGFLAPDRK
jgi:hypothetical protein